MPGRGRIDAVTPATYFQDPVHPRPEEALMLFRIDTAGKAADAVPASIKERFEDLERQGGSSGLS